MAQDPKKPEEKTEKKPPATDQIPAAEMTYPTPELDPKTGAPVDTRFQSDNSQEATAPPTVTQKRSEKSAGRRSR